MTARARGAFVCSALVAKQFKLEIEVRATILIDEDFYSFSCSKAFKNTLGTSGVWLSSHVLRHVREQKL